MSTIDRQAHWENVYTTKREAEVSWFQGIPEPSRQLIALVGATRHSAIIDIGGGASCLVDSLVSDGYEDLTVLDLSAAALDAAKARLGERGRPVQWLTADATAWEPSRTYDVWHGRYGTEAMPSSVPSRLTAPRNAVDCPWRGMTPRALARPWGKNSSLSTPADTSTRLLEA